MVTSKMVGSTVGLVVLGVVALGLLVLGWYKYLPYQLSTQSTEYEEKCLFFGFELFENFTRTDFITHHQNQTATFFRPIQLAKLDRWAILKSVFCLRSRTAWTRLYWVS